MIIKIKDLKKYIFYIAYIFIISATMLERVNNFEKIATYLEIFSIVILMFNFIIDSRYNKKELFFYLIMILLIGISTVINKNFVILKLMLLILGSKGIEFDDFIKFDFKIRTILFFLVMFLHTKGLTNDYLSYRNGIIRNSMGFSHPNIFGLHVLVLNMELLYMKQGKMNIISFIVGFISIFSINYFSDSRTSIYMLILLMLASVFLRFGKLEKLRNNKIFRVISENLFYILTAIIFIFVLQYRAETDLGIKINEILSSRIYCINNIIENYGFSLFGKNIPLIATETARIMGLKPLVLDNAYFNILLRHGFFVYVIMGIIFSKSIERMFKDKKMFCVICMLLFIIYGISETHMFNVCYNVFLMYFANVIFRKKEGSET